MFDGESEGAVGCVGSGKHSQAAMAEFAGMRGVGVNAPDAP